MQLNTKTGYIKLQVSPSKLGAVLSAIGAALDGHPWTPYTSPKTLTRGSRGGRKQREMGYVEPLKGKHVSRATNPLAGASVGGVPILSRSIKPSVGFSKRVSGSQHASPEKCLATQKIRTQKSSNADSRVGLYQSIGTNTKQPSIVFGNFDVSSHLAYNAPNVEVCKAAIGSSKSVASKSDLSLTGAGRRILSGLNTKECIPSTSDGRASIVEDRNRDKDKVPHLSTQTLVSNRFDVIQSGIYQCAEVDESTVSKVDEVESLREMVVILNKPTYRNICKYKKAFRPRLQNSNHGFFGIGKDLSYRETEQEYETALRLHVANHRLRCTACIVPGPRHDNISHLSTCGNACSCKASSNRRYIELLAKHRRCFVATSASGSRDSNPTLSRASRK